MIGHRTMASTLAFMGDLVGARVHYNEALALYRAAEHRRLMTRFGQDLRVTCVALSFNAPVAARLSRGCAQ